MVVNPAGYVIVMDYGNPHIISGRAREVLSGGQFATASGVAGVISSGVNSFDPVADLMFRADGSGTEFTGIVMQNAGSNESVSIATNGIFIVTSAGTIVAGRNLVANGDHALAEGTADGTIVGRALSSAGSEGYVLAQIGQV